MAKFGKRFFNFFNGREMKKKGLSEKNTEKLKADSSVKETVKLFTVWESSRIDENDFSYYSKETVTVNNEGQLFLERTSSASDMHSLTNSYSHTITTKITYEELPELIAKSKDPRAKKYVGMTEDNRHTYLSQE